MLRAPGSVPQNGGCPRECPTGCPRGHGSACPKSVPSVSRLLWKAGGRFAKHVFVFCYMFPFVRLPCKICCCQVLFLNPVFTLIARNRRKQKLGKQHSPTNCAHSVQLSTCDMGVLLSLYFRSLSLSSLFVSFIAWIDLVASVSSFLFWFVSFLVVFFFALSLSLSLSCSSLDLSLFIICFVWLVFFICWGLFFILCFCCCDLHIYLLCLSLCVFLFLSNLCQVPDFDFSNLQVNSWSTSQNRASNKRFLK